MDNMKLIMDADCLIKLTKAHLKEEVCSCFTVAIPQQVKREVVDAGEGHPDAAITAENLRIGILQLDRVKTSQRKREEAVLSAYRRGDYNGICSDDRRFVRRLRALGVPYLTPAVLVLLLARKGRLTCTDARVRLDALRSFISSDEYTLARLKLETLSQGDDR